MFPHFDQSEYAVALQNAYRQFPAKDSTLDIDFINNRQRVAGVQGAALDGVTFTRSTTGTYFDATGTMQTAAINAPRFEYDPVSLRPLGLLIEESRANILLNSDTGATQSVAVSATAYTLSFWGTGTVTLSGASTAGPLVGTSANTRVTLSFTPTAGTLTLTVSGTVTKWQLEAGGFATSYISTAGASATRGAEVPSMTGANFSSWYDHNGGTIFVESSVLSGTINAYPSLFEITDGSSNNWIGLSTNPFNNARVGIRTGGVVQVDMYAGQTSTIFQSGNNVWYDFAFATNDAAASVGGEPVSIDTSCTIPSGLTQARIGSSAWLNTWSGHIRRVIYYPKRMPNNLLQYLSRPTA